MARWLAAVGLSWAIVTGMIGGMVLTLLARPVPAFSLDRVSIISWRGNGDAVPANVATTGWSAPMFYTTPAEGANPAPPPGKYPTGVWAPGDTMERTLLVRNLDDQFMMLLSQLQIDLSGNLGLAPWMTLSIRGPDGETLYRGRMTGGAAAPLLTLNPPVLLRKGEQRALAFAVSLDRNADQRLQGESIVADVTLVAIPHAFPISIDIHPASWPNPINPGALGNIPVAINGSAGFDLHDLDWESARFGPNRIKPIRQAAFEDWNADGYTDMILHFSNQASGITCGMTEASLTIAAHSGEVFEGADAIVTPPCR